MSRLPIDDGPQLGSDDLASGRTVETNESTTRRAATSRLDVTDAGVAGDGRTGPTVDGVWTTIGEDDG